MSNVFRPVNPVSDRNMFIFKGSVFIKRAEYEQNLVCYASLRLFNMQRVNPQPRGGSCVGAMATLRVE